MSQRRVAPSAKLAKPAEELVAQVDRQAEGSALLGQLAQLGAQRLIQEALEQQQAEHLDRGWYERRSADAARCTATAMRPGI